MDGVFQLANIAGPAVQRQRLARLGRERPHRYAIGVGVFLGEELRELDHVGGPLAERRQLQVDDVEAEQQVLAEGAGARRFHEIAVGGGDDADIDRHRAGAADAVDDALLDGAKKLRLEPNVHFRDFVEQQRTAGRLLELADAAGDGAGEGALLVAEQFRLQKVLRDRRAVDADERLFRTVGTGVDVTRQHLLAGAGFAGDQHRGVGGGDLRRELDHLRGGVVAVDQVAGIVGDGGEHRRDQLRIGRQRDVFLRAGMDRLDRGARIVLDTAGHDGDVNVFELELGDEVADIDNDIDHQQIRAPGA